MKMRLFSIFVVVFAANLCMAQSNRPVAATNWGKSVQGVRLSIAMTNSVVTMGSSSTILTVVTNASTNAIKVTYTGRPSDFDVVLTSTRGTAFHMIEPAQVETLRTMVEVKSGGQDVRTIGLTFAQPPGDYTLQATRYFSGGKLESNLLKVQIK